MRCQRCKTCFYDKEASPNKLECLLTSCPFGRVLCEEPQGGEPTLLGCAPALLSNIGLGIKFLPEANTLAYLSGH